jgi:ubiquinone/menaquinone biosynthesis C-methylase UbiE
VNISSELYNKIGHNYNKTRIPDLRIFNELLKLLNNKYNDKIIDIGAGTGNYSFLLAKTNFIVDIFL